MNNLFFKSANRLIKNDSINLEKLDNQLDMLLREQRLQRADLRDINGKLDKVLVDKHLQMQVDEYFNTEEARENADSK